MRVAIIGGGWYGVHTALYLDLKGYEVTVYEKNDDIFQGISGNFGIRLHLGPHYPRSEKTREGCRRGYGEFYNIYPEIIVEHESAVYGLGDFDADSEPPKVSPEAFDAVCEEYGKFHKIEPAIWNFESLQSAYDIREPSIVIGERLRAYFREKILQSRVKISCKFTVDEIKQDVDGAFVAGNGATERFDFVINATSYQSFLPPTLPLGIDVVYQACLAFAYDDKETKDHEKPISFIVMDGWFPSLMPYLETPEKAGLDRKYILTHGKWTILGSYATPQEARKTLEEAKASPYLDTAIRANCESEMNRFWPEFKTRFKYDRCKGTVVAKLKTHKEFRNAVVFKQDKVVYIIPGKVSNIFDAAREVAALLTSSKIIADESGFEFVKGGILDDCRVEATEKPHSGVKNTCTLQTYSELISRLHSRSSEDEPTQELSLSISSSDHPEAADAEEAVPLSSASESESRTPTTSDELQPHTDAHLSTSLPSPSLISRFFIPAETNNHKRERSHSGNDLELKFQPGSGSGSV